MGPRNGRIPDRCAIIVNLKPAQYQLIADTATRGDRSMASVVRQVMDRYFADLESQAGQEQAA